jgi:hypothetical protein
VPVHRATRHSACPLRGRPAERPLRAPSRQNRGVSLIVVDLSGTIRHAEIRLSLCRLDRRGECDVVGALLAATVDEGRRGARNSAGAGRVDVIGHPVGPDTYAGLHSVLAEARERGIPGRIPRHEHRVSTASRRSSASTCGTSPTSPPPPESMRVGGNKNRWKQEGCLHPPGSPRRPPPR